MIDIGALIQQGNATIHTLVGGNEIAAGMIIAGVMGSATYICRTIPNRLYLTFIKHTTTTMVLNNTTESYYRLLKFLRDEGLSDRSRYINISNGRWGYEEEDLKQIGYGSQFFFYRKIPLRITLEKEKSDSDRPKEFLKITKFGRSHNLFNEMLEEMKEATKNKDNTSFYKCTKQNKEYVTSQPSRSLESIILPKEKKDFLIKALDNFIAKEEWYIQNGIPYQLGIFLYGPPGTGKTTLIKGIATYLDKDICFVDNILDFSHAALRYNDCVITVEEIDTLGITKRSGLEGDEDSKPLVAQSLSSSEKESPKLTTTSKSSGKKEDEEDSLEKVYGKLALGKILNSLDGVISNHGRIMIITSNKADDLDPALMRPGRIDLKLEIGFLDIETFKETINKFFPDFDFPDNLQVKPNTAPVDIQNKILLGYEAQDLIKEYCV